MFRCASMQRLLSQCSVTHRKSTSAFTGRTFHRLFTAKSRLLAATERQERLRDAPNDLISATMTQPQTVTGLSQSPAIPLMEPTIASEASVFDLPQVSLSPEVTSEKTPLPFEDIPGPAVLKILEKYWRYVPLFGTQLICSLLINKFTLGQLRWNRNVTPLKYLFNEYGPIVRIHGPFAGDIVMVHRPEHIAEVYKQEGESPVRSGIDVLQHYRLHYRKYRLPGPFSMQGGEWTELRKKLEKPFASQLTQYFGKLEMTCDELVQRIRKIRNRQDEVPGDFNQELSRWGMECFSILMLNRRLGFLEPSGLNITSEPARLIEALTCAHLYLSRCETGFQVWRFFETPFIRKLFAACDVIDGVIGKYIRQTQNKLRTQSASIRGEGKSEQGVDEDSSPVLEKLLVDQGMQPDDISTLMMDMIILGVQATANSQAFLLYYLAKNPRIQRRVYDEVSAVMPNRGATVTQYLLKKMPYLRACINECLRLRPAFPYVTRALPKPITLHGYTIPKDTYVIMATQISSQREENFEDPEKFKPERWLSGKTESGDKREEFSCLPFGYGIRSCLGRQMAETEMMLLTTKLIREFRIEYDYADISSNYMMVNVPNKSLRFRFVDRD